MTADLPGVTRASEQIATFLRRVRDPLVREAGAFAAWLAAQPRLGATSARILDDELLPRARSVLQAIPAATGAGFVALPELINASPWYMAWWQGDPLRRVVIPQDGSGDYRPQAWFREPQRSHRIHMTAPYVDYVCTEEYVLTTTVPVLIEGRFAGVFGADVPVADVQDQLEDILADIDDAALVVHETGRILASNDAAWETGELIDPPIQAWREIRASEPVDDLPYRLVVASPDRVSAR